MLVSFQLKQTHWLISIPYGSFSQVHYSFGLGHHHQGKGQSVKPWFRRSRKPFVPCDKREAQRILQQILQKIGQPPLELLCQLLDNPKGGAPW